MSAMMAGEWRQRPKRCRMRMPMSRSEVRVRSETTPSASVQRGALFSGQPSKVVRSPRLLR